VHHRVERLVKCPVTKYRPHTKKRNSQKPLSEQYKRVEIIKKKDSLPFVPHTHTHLHPHIYKERGGGGKPPALYSQQR
jgi:hypothetical protein